tara:strand:- start:8583 stop:9410 length:828 start_codon:yes stop_codon:yes gene_type:complete
MTELNPSTVEIVSSESDATRCSIALFDFDGTISLIRSGWTDVMVPMMVEILAGLGGDESEGELTTVVEEYVARLTGKQTIYQMIELARQISLRGGKPLEPMMYKHMYLNRLDAHIKLRVEGLSAGTISPDELMVPGSRSLMQTLQKRGLSLYLASGTDESYLSREAELLQVDTYFDGHIYGAREDYKNFSKKILINRILCEGNFKGENFLAFGDGYVEIENVKEVGGCAVGVASDEPICLRVDPVKRQRLVRAGADWIIPNYNRLNELLSILFPS